MEEDAPATSPMTAVSFCERSPGPPVCCVGLLFQRIDRDKNKFECAQSSERQVWVGARFFLCAGSSRDKFGELLNPTSAGAS